MMNFEFLVDLLEMSINTYHNTDLSNMIYRFGYEDDGVRCKLFEYGNSLVLAIKGTSLNILGFELGETSANDKEMVNIMFNTCKRRSEGGHRNEDCAYIKKVNFDKLHYLSDLRIVVDSIKHLYPGKEVILTGHSLGGALAALLSMIYKFKCITFASPGEEYFSKILNLHKGESDIAHYGMCNDSIYTGKCDKLCKILGYKINTKKHSGKVYCINIDTKIKSVIFHNSSVLLSYLKKLI
jgi:lipase ATG15